MGFFRINAQPGKVTSVLLSAALFVLSLAAYVWVAHERHQENPQDKVVPTLSEMKGGVKRTAIEEDRKGDVRLWVDTWASGKRFLICVALMSIAVLIGLHMGVLPYFEALLLRFVTFFDKIPALALLPILMIIFGIGEMSKIALIVIGVFPTIILDTFLRAKAVPREQVTKGLTLGASDMEVAYRIVLPQILPGVLDTIRLNFKAVILFLIAGESVAATVGLGYRIFVVRRYIAMDIIIPYVIWMSLLAYLADLGVRYFVRWRYHWQYEEA
ncbi:MAG: ABC transporter permease subunit [bacterium]|nr:ABC transporter permease subunit [bacterium]